MFIEIRLNRGLTVFGVSVIVVIDAYVTICASSLQPHLWCVNQFIGI